ncbi:aminotransferase [Falsigemmobacter intermedius]|uniref:aspartate transaminase n=1 Tax=Falsigemmobacter intermedius TaxID=1553448 RepID=A0A444MEV6_9RHOB|nr:aminotransferase [Falsigemmobacter intermedius]RWY43537.1 aminotransferase [Falsigemmobacter intermedius]
MIRPLNPAMATTFAPPVMEAHRWRASTALPAGLSLINVSQAAPTEVPPLPLREAIAEAALHQPAAHLYGAVLGMDELREEIAAQWSRAYAGRVRASQVAITQGCNQAFCAVLATLAAPGDEIILTVPWYFNHKMWLDMQGVKAVPLTPGAGLIPEAEAAARLITDRTKAIVLVSPNNPGGAEYPAETMAAFRDLCRARGLALIVDETYRDFDSRDGRVHDLFMDPDWSDVLVQLYSFSKAYRLTGHRVGAIVASEARLAEVEKFLDTVAICPGQLGQIAALWGMRNLGRWVEGERQEILARRRAVEAAIADLPGWELMGAGAFFAYARHPFAGSGPEVAKAILSEQGVLMLPGTMFMPEGSAGAHGQMRIAFANCDADGLREMAARLDRLTLPRR